MAEILEGAATPAQLAGFVVALRMKGETVEELSGLLDAMLAAAALVEVPDAELRTALVDIVGTGGDRSHTINVSTLAVVRRGRRRRAGVQARQPGGVVGVRCRPTCSKRSACSLELSPDDVARCIETAGMAFCFAPRFHPALRHAGPPAARAGRARRRSTSSARWPTRPGSGARWSGWPTPRWPSACSACCASAAPPRVMIVHGDDGLDELTTTTSLHRVGAATATPSGRWTVDPGRPRPGAGRRRRSCVGGDAATNAGLARAVLAGERGPHRDVVVLNAAAGLARRRGAWRRWPRASPLAGAVLDDGRAAAVLDRLVTASQAGRPSTAA